MAAALTDDQEAATKRFLEAVNSRRNPATDGQGDPVDWATAVRFLLARKFDVARATALFEQHELTRHREGLFHFDPSSDPLRSELATGKFTILPSRDAMGAAIAVFTANLHVPQASTHQTTLQGIVYQLDVALQSVDTQRAGLVFVYDMSDSKYSNFDFDLSQKILMLLKGGYPAKLKKVLIVTAPLWFKAPFKILRLFVREKLRERVFTVSVPQLPLHVPRASLPRNLGGPLQIDHEAWLLYCFKSMNNCNGTVGDIPNYIINNHLSSGTDILRIMNGNSVQAKINHTMNSDNIFEAEDRINTPNLANGNPKMHIINHTELKRGKKDNNNADIDSACGDKLNAGSSGDEEDLKISPNNHTLWCPYTSLQCGSANSDFSDDDSLAAGDGALTPAAFLARVNLLGREGLIEEYDEIKHRPLDGTFIHTSMKNNLPKNRYNDVLCYDHSRVCLQRQDESDICSDYINANFVDGYKEKNAFISTQGPLPNTYGDFWRMVWEVHSMVIVMTTRTVEQGRHKCGQYWQPEAGQQCQHGNFNILTESVEANSDFVVCELLLTNLQTKESRTVSHWQFVSWPDYGVPGSAGAVLRFIAGVRARQAQNLLDHECRHCRPPIIVHCSAGIGRTGTFCALDICISRLEDTGLIDVKGTVEKIRSQRAYSIQMPDQYIFCHLALIEYALDQGYLQSADLAGFNDSKDDDSD
ncbi:protein tyrosine phosphatase Meg2 isoform X2 [Arctopsyche grandis]|uniref:protein tyrosine phosphatase Meg2 isoform X2 n=1 Tax=Arctopsyche grandis TaxID=121162 RepID=UPI00406D64D9